MACFIVPATEAVFTTIVTKIIEKKEAGCIDENISIKKERFW